MSLKLDKSLVIKTAAPLVMEEGMRLLDAKVANNGGKIILELIIDKKGGVNIQDCEKISKIVDPVLDELEGVSGKYDYFTVSSAGIDRAFESTDDYLTHIGEKIEVKLYSAVDKKKMISDVLMSADDEFIVLGDKTKILRSNIQKANIAIEF